MSKLIQAVKQILQKTKDEGFQDRLKDTALDTFTLTQYMQNAKFLGLKDKDEGVSIGYRLDTLMLYSTMGRSQITRTLRLSEVGVEYVSSNEHQTQAIRFTINQGRPTSLNECICGYPEVFYFLLFLINRHKNVEFCTVSALAIHLVHRFHVEGGINQIRVRT